MAIPRTPNRFVTISFHLLPLHLLLLRGPVEFVFDAAGLLIEDLELPPLALVGVTM